MNKILRYSFIMLLALIWGGVNAQEVTLDFTDNTNWKFPEGSKAKINTEAQYTNGKYTITIGANSDGHYWNNYSKPYYLIMGKQGATLTLPAFDFDIAKIEVVGNSGASDKVEQNIFVGEQAVSTSTTGAKTSNVYAIAKDYQAKGNIYTLKVTSKHNTQISAIKIYKVGSPDSPDVPSTPTADNIAAFKALTSGTTAILTLKDAQVVYKNVYTTSKGATNTEYYVRDASGAIQFYNTDLELEVGQILKGTVEVKYSPFNDMPEAAKTANTSAEKLTITTGTVTPKTVTVTDLTNDTYLCDLVTVENAKIATEEEGTYTNQYLISGDDKVMVYDKFKTGAKIENGEGFNVTGILVTAKLSGNIVREFAPISAPVATGISNITTDAASANAPVYNLAGQKVSASYKGVVVKAGKKYIQK